MAIMVRALERGFSGGQFREIGDEFPVEKDKLGKWMKVIGPRDTIHEDRPKGGNTEPEASLAKVKGKAKA